jgi:hypothetical protein
MFLSQEQIVVLTGKQQPSAQRRALNAMGLTYKIRPDGSLVVLECHVQQELGGIVQSSAPLPKSEEPNWGAI